MEYYLKFTFSGGQVYTTSRMNITQANAMIVCTRKISAELEIFSINGFGLENKATLDSSGLIKEPLTLRKS